MLPVFHPTIFLRLSIFQLWVPNRIKLSQVLPENLSRLCVLNLWMQNRGNAARFSPNLFLRLFKFPILGSKHDKFSQSFPENLSRLCELQSWDAKQGNMLPVFHPIFFGRRFDFPILGSNKLFWTRICQLFLENFKVCDFQFWGAKQGEMLPVFRPFFWGLFDFPVLGLQEGQIQSIFQSFEGCVNFGFARKTGGNAACFCSIFFTQY